MIAWINWFEKLNLADIFQFLTVTILSLLPTLHFIFRTLFSAGRVIIGAILLFKLLLFVVCFCSWEILCTYIVRRRSCYIQGILVEISSLYLLRRESIRTNSNKSYLLLSKTLLLYTWFSRKYEKRTSEWLTCYCKVWVISWVLHYKPGAIW